jgi:hypothetical protein
MRALVRALTAPLCQPCVRALMWVTASISNAFASARTGLHVPGAMIKAHRCGCCWQKKAGECVCVRVYCLCVPVSDVCGI